MKGNVQVADVAGVGIFGVLLKRRRDALAWSQEELADATRGQVAVRTISDLERGVARRPRSATVRLLAEALSLAGAELAAFNAAARGRPDPGSAGAAGTGAGRRAGPDAATTVAAPRPVPRMLPRDIQSFTGREAELDVLIAAASSAHLPGTGHPGTIGVCAVEGMGGVGKTALALRAAHLVAERFTGGQLFIDLQGYTPGVPPLSPDDALRSLLIALGVRREAIPEETAERAALYRSTLAGTRTLVILDNAQSAAQVEPLLPGTAGCLVIVTSRRSLAALDDAHPLALDALPPEKAIRLFRVVAGPGRATADDPDVAEIAELCGQLPLAIRIAAARLARRPELRLSDLLRELRSEHRRLAELADGERGVAAAIELSYRNLPVPAQRIFGYLGLIPGPDFDVLAVASLAGDADLAAVQAEVDILLDHNLLLASGAGRYRFHDLVRDFARTRADTLGPDGAAFDRLLGYYLYGAKEADRHLERRNHVRDGDRPPHWADKPSALPKLSSATQAVAWVSAELPNLAATLRAAHSLGRGDYTLALAHALAVYLRSNGPWALATELHGLALADATRLGDDALVAQALTEIGLIEFQLGRLAAATSTLTRAAEGFRAARDRVGEADALVDLGLMHRMSGQLEAASACLDAAIALYQAAGKERGEASALRELGAVQRQAGRFEDSERSLTRARTLFAAAGYRYGEASVLAYLGGVRMAVKSYAPAREALEAALAIYRAVDDPQGQANCLLFLGKAHLDAGALDLAEPALAEAGELYGRMGDRRGQAGVLAFLGDTQRLAGKNRRAAASLAEALRLFREVGDPGGEAETANIYAAVALADGDPDLARQRYTAGVRIARQIESQRDLADALAGIAATHQAQHRAAAARRQYAKALTAYESMNCAADAARVRASLTELGALFADDLAAERQALGADGHPGAVGPRGEGEAVHLIARLGAEAARRRAGAGRDRLDRRQRRRLDLAGLQHPARLADAVGADADASVARHEPVDPGRWPAAERACRRRADPGRPGRRGGPAAWAPAGRGVAAPAPARAGLLDDLVHPLVAQSQRLADLAQRPASQVQRPHRVPELRPRGVERPVRLDQPRLRRPRRREQLLVDRHLSSVNRH